MPPRFGRTLSNKWDSDRFVRAESQIQCLPGCSCLTGMERRKGTPKEKLPRNERSRLCRPLHLELQTAKDIATSSWAQFIGRNSECSTTAEFFEVWLGKSEELCHGKLLKKDLFGLCGSPSIQRQGRKGREAPDMCKLHTERTFGRTP